MTILYFRKDEELFGKKGFAAHCFGLKPDGKGTLEEFNALKRKIDFRKDLEWKEFENIQKIFRSADIWTSFPVSDAKFITAEFGGSEKQRIDLLYLRNNGEAYPCELKLDSKAVDAHGQLIRYISDLFYQNIDKEWLLKKRMSYLKRTIKSRKIDNRDTLIEERSIDDFLEKHNLKDADIHASNKSGIIINEKFDPKTQKAVKYLNEECSFDIRLLTIEAYVADNWKVDDKIYLMKFVVNNVIL